MSATMGSTEYKTGTSTYSFTNCTMTSKYLPKPGKLYPTFLKNIIPEPERTADLSLFERIQAVTYNVPDGVSRDIIDRCVYNNITLKCGYSPETMKIVNTIHAKLVE